MRNVVHTLKPFWYNYAWKKLADVLLVLQNLPALHFRNCALLLRRRLDLVIEKIATIQNLSANRTMVTYELLCLYCELCQLIVRLEKIFGFIILLNVIIDLLVTTVSIYMIILYALGPRNPELLWISILTIVLPISKYAMIVSPLDDLGNQVKSP